MNTLKQMHNDINYELLTTVHVYIFALSILNKLEELYIEM